MSQKIYVTTLKGKLVFEVFDSLLVKGKVLFGSEGKVVFESLIEKSASKSRKSC